MAKIYFICGFIGSGKTTYSKQLTKTEGAYRFSPDEWMLPLFGEHMERDLFDERFSTLVELFKKSALELLLLNVPVIFDFGFWSRKERESIIDWALQMDLEYEVIYLDVSYGVCCARAQKRNFAQDEHAYEMTPEMLELFWSWFEVPQEEEAVTTLVEPIFS